MATAYLREYSDVKAIFGHAVPVPAEPSITTQTPITTSGTTAASSAFNAQTNLVAVSTPAAQAVAIEFSQTPGATPTATTSSLRLPANSLFFFGVRPGDKLALIDVT